MPKRGRERQPGAAGVWRRRTGVIYRPWTLGAPDRPLRNWVLSNDGGDDAPLGARGRIVFRCALTVVVLAGVGLIMWARP